MIPLVDLARQHNPLRKEIDKAIARVIDRSAFVLGEELEKFESEFAAFCGVKYAVGVSCGSDALRLAVLALGIGPGDEVISVANTFTSTIDAAVHAGAKPVLVDCDDYFNIDVTQIEKNINKNTKAIIVVHLYGQPAEMNEIMRLAKKYRLFVIEDCAHAHGALYHGKKVGSFGDAGCFSFYPGKNLGAMGDGGMITTNNKNLDTKIRKLRFHGQGKREYYHELVGFNHLLDNIQAAILRIKLKHLESWNADRQRAAHTYNSLLYGVVETPKEMKDASHVYHLYVIKTKRRDNLLSFLQKNGVIAKIHYPIPLHLLEAHKRLGYRVGDFPVSEKDAREILSLPIFPGITKKEIVKTADLVKQFISS